MSFSNYQLPPTGGLPPLTADVGYVLTENVPPGTASWQPAAGGAGTVPILVAVNHTPGNFDSATSIPLGAVVSRVDICVDTAYPAGCTIAVYVDGGVQLVMDVGKSDLTTTNGGLPYIYLPDPVVVGAGIVRAVLAASGSHGTGAARVYVTYATPAV